MGRCRLSAYTDYFVPSRPVHTAEFLEWQHRVDDVGWLIAAPCESSVFVSFVWWLPVLDSAYVQGMVR